MAAAQATMATGGAVHDVQATATDSMASIASAIDTANETGLLEVLMVFSMVCVVSLIRGCRSPSKPPRKKLLDDKCDEEIENLANAGRHEEVLERWRASANGKPLTIACFTHVIKAFLEVCPDTLVREVADYISTAKAGRFVTFRSAAMMTISTAGNIAVMEEFVDVMRERFGTPPTVQIQEYIAGAYAHAGLMDKFLEAQEALRNTGATLSARYCKQVLRCMLRHREPDAALEIAKEMKGLGYTITPFLVTNLYRVFCKAGRMKDVMETVLPEITPSSNAALLMLQQCDESRDFALAHHLAGLFQKHGPELCPRSQEQLLRLYVAAASPNAFGHFQQFCDAGLMNRHTFCVFLVSACAEVKFVRFAEAVVQYWRSHHALSVSIYSALMKVYANCGMFSNACDLYDQMVAEDLGPDFTLCGNLMHYASECGRHDLLSFLESKVPSGPPHRFITAIRRCNKDKSVEKAIGILDQAIIAGCTDRTIFKCALDVCANSGDVEQTRKVLTRMKDTSELDLTSYNTALKVFGRTSDLKGALQMVQEMEEAGFIANEITYNVLLDIAVQIDGLRGGWEVVEKMTDKGICVDTYTVTTLLKPVKRTCAQDLMQVLTFMDSLGIDPTCDEVLMNNVLDSCIRHKLVGRVRAILNSALLMNLTPSCQTYGMLIRAGSCVKDFKLCQQLWDDMVNFHGLASTEVSLGAMVETLINNGRVEEDGKLTASWGADVLPSAATCATLLRASLDSRDFSQSIALLQSFRKAKVVDTRMYNVFINVCAKEEKMGEIPRVFEMMKEDGCKPDSFTTALIIKGYCYSCQFTKAQEVFDNLFETEGHVDAVSFNTLLNGCVSLNKWSVAESLVKNMDSYGFKPSNVTLGTIIKMWGTRRNVAKCFEAVERFASKYSIQPNGMSRACLVCACALCNSIKGAAKTIEDMRADGQGLNGKPLETVIKACMRCHQMDVGVQILDKQLDLRAASAQEVDSHIFEKLRWAVSMVEAHQQVDKQLFEKLAAVGAKVPKRKIMSEKVAKRSDS